MCGRANSYLDRVAGLAPGPGQYNLDGLAKEGEEHSSHGHGTGFGTGTRDVGKKSAGEMVPGPGQYFTNKDLGGPSIGFG